jgi:hypothetical protein
MRKADMNKKMRSAEKLFDAIGMIDDRIITEAADLSKSSKAVKSYPFFRRYAVTLTSLFLVVAMIGGVLVANWSKDMGAESLKDNLDRDEVQVRETLDFVLSDAVTNEKATLLSFDEIDFFDGEVSLIWTYGDEDEYHKLVFEERYAESEVKNCMSKSVELISTENADDNVCKVWVSYGNGEVVSPYLRESAGNVSYAELFEYSPEVVPSESFCDMVREALDN